MGKRTPRGNAPPPTAPPPNHAPPPTAPPGPARLPDATARERILTDLKTNLLVEAGAGSGKTTSLVGRMVALVSSGEARVERMAAVTFTRKAAAELRQRFQLELEEAVRKEVDPLKRSRLAEALADLDRCFLGTIHSFCARLLRERPIEAGLDPCFEELQGDEDAVLRAQAWSEYLDELRFSGSTGLTQLDELGVSLSDLQQTYARLALYPDLEVFRQAVPRPDLARARQALSLFAARVGKLLPQSRPEKGWDPLQTALRRALHRNRVFRPGEDRQVVRTLEILDKELQPTLNRWDSKDTAKDAGDQFEAFRAGWVQPTLWAWREHRHSVLIEAVLPAASHYEERRRVTGRLNFQDLLMRSAALLRENPEVRRYFAQRHTHLLIDEFQDTDPVQAEVMFLLAGTPEDETDWRRVAPRPGSLFVVGDPKQSIYRFRRADIATYNLVKRRTQQTGGDVVTLTTNFRSVHAIGSRVTSIFEGVLPAQATRYQAAFAPVDAIRAGGVAGVEGLRVITVGKIKWNRAQTIAELDAQRIARWIARACAGVARPARPGDFLILLRRKKHMDLYARALESEGLPYQVAGAETFGESVEVRELLKLLRGIADPDDPVHLLASLRGLYFGLSDDLLYRFKRAGGRFAFTSRAPEELPDGLQPVAAALGRLRRYWGWSREDPPPVALERIIEDLGVLPFAAGGEMGNSRAGNLLKALDIVRNGILEATSSFADAVDFLAAAFEQGTIEEGKVLPGTGRAVALMNLHKAKGLEAPVVFLADPTGAMEHEPTEHVDRTGDRCLGHFLIGKSGTYGFEVIAQPPGWADRSEEEKRYQLAEEERLLYVAATRARDLLVISRYAGKPEISPWCRLEGALADAPELEELEEPGEAALAAESPPGESPPGESSPGEALPGLPAADVLGGELERDMATSATLLRAAARPGFSRLAVTDLTKAHGDAPPWQEGGRGMSWGSTVHRLLEAAGRGLSPEGLKALAPIILAEEGRPEDDLPSLLDLVRGVQASPLWERVRRAERRQFEVPFAVRAAPGELGLASEAAADTPIVLRGVVDLAFREPDGWVLVDYKTDRVEDGALDRFVAFYAPQVQCYADYWTRITGEPVKARLLFFVAAGEVVVV